MPQLTTTNECRDIQTTSILSICYSENEQRFVSQNAYIVPQTNMSRY